MKRLARLLTIVHIVAYYRLENLLPKQKPFFALKILCKLMPTRWFGSAWSGKVPEDPNVRLRLALIALGPVFIKFGQLLSTRRDMLPEALADELHKLQDQVPPFPGDEAKAMIEQALKKPVEQAFKYFDPVALASASVAQVHAATLPNGDDVVIKVIRPGIENIIDRDLDLMDTLARLLEKLWPEGRRYHPVTVVSDYRHILSCELNLRIEAANTQQLKRNFDGSPLLYVPQVYWDYTTRGVMVMERIYGIRVNDIDALKAAGVNLEQLAINGVETFFTQVFRDNFFHADMHPGNIFVSTENPENPRYIAVDCAIIGSLGKEEQVLLARQLMALMEQDYTKVATLLIDAGWVAHDTSVQAFATALRSVLEPVLDKPLDEFEFGAILIGLFQAARAFEMQSLPQFVLLEKTLLYVEGLGRQLYPQLDIWRIARPLLETWARSQLGPEALFSAFRANAPAWLEQLPAMPRLAYDALSQIKEDHALRQQHLLELQALRKTMAQENHRSMTRTSLGIALLAGAVLVATGPLDGLSLTQIPGSSWLLGVCGIILLIPQLTGKRL